MDENIRSASFMFWRWIYWMGNRGVPSSMDVDMSCEEIVSTLEVQVTTKHSPKPNYCTVVNYENDDSHYIRHALYNGL